MEMVFQLIKLSGGLLVVMGVLLLIALTVIVERGWFFHRIIGAGCNIEHGLRQAGQKDLPALAEVSEAYKDTPQGRLIALALDSKSPADPDELSREMDEEVLWLIPRLDRGMWIIETTVTLGPLLGLFGTVVGMVQTFNVLSNSGQAIKATGGIADALVSTGMGLAIAIVSVAFQNYFNKRLRLALHQLELIGVILVNRLKGTVPARREPELDESTAAQPRGVADAAVAR